MPPSTRKGKWYASLTFYWECPECGLQLLEGNPTKCPHQNGGKRLQYHPADGPVNNLADVWARCGGKEPGQKVKKSLISLPPPEGPQGMTLDDLLKAECPKGG